MPDYAVVDASVVVALAAMEADKLPTAHAQMAAYATAGTTLYAPGVLVGECLFALCRKVTTGVVSVCEYRTAVSSLQAYLTSFRLIRRGDLDLATRAETVRGTYGCSHSADGLYVALAEQLARRGSTELVTYDIGLQRLARAASPGLSVNLLVP